MDTSADPLLYDAASAQFQSYSGDEEGHGRSQQQQQQQRLSATSGTYNSDTPPSSALAADTPSARFNQLGGLPVFGYHNGSSNDSHQPSPFSGRGFGDYGFTPTSAVAGHTPSSSAPYNNNEPLSNLNAPSLLLPDRHREGSSGNASPGDFHRSSASSSTSLQPQSGSSSTSRAGGRRSASSPSQHQPSPSGSSSASSRHPPQPAYAVPSPSATSTTNNINNTPVYSQDYGSSYVSLQPVNAPFVKVIQQTDDDRFSEVDSGATDEAAGTGHPDAKKRKRKEGSGRTSPAFDPNAPNMPRAATGNYPGLYSVSGFDALGVLARVAFRPSPQIDLGPIDMSTAFCVVDARKRHLPIVYASESFSDLTGYANVDIIGKNCRFLQSPEGKVEQGSPRRFTDGDGVYHLRQHITSARESQVSIVNYKKNKTPFINLISVIPITWDSDEVAYFVGFQLNLTEQPKELLRRIKQGNYTVNFSVLPGPPLPNPTSLIMSSGDSGQSSASASPEVATSPRYTVEQAVIEGVPDFVFALSVKGAILYASPSGSRALGYTMRELLSANISDLCHPNDVTHVVRELKEAANNPESSVNITFRARNKTGKFFWIDGNARVHVEEGRNRKSIALIGRQSSVPSLAREVLSSTGGITTADFWHRLTPSGLCIYSCPAVQRLYGHAPHDLVGSSIARLLQPAQLPVFVRSLQSAAGQGSASALRHYLRDSKGQWQDVVTTFFPPVHANGASRREALIVCQTSSFTEKVRIQPNFAQVAPGQAVPFVAPEPTHGGQAAPSTNVLAELEPNRNSSWHFELQKLQRSNRDLEAEIQKLEQLKAASAGARRSSNTNTGRAVPPSLSPSSYQQQQNQIAASARQQPAPPPPPPFMQNCVNCGSSDIPPDQLSLGSSLCLCSTCSVGWQPAPEPSPDTSGNYGLDDYDMSMDGSFGL